MPGSLADKQAIRTALIQFANAGELTYYGELGEKVGKHARWPLWKPILDEISREETQGSERYPQGKPDITFIVLNSASGWPGQIGFKPTNGNPTQTQIAKAQEELTKVFKLYCPGKSVPQLPLPKRK